MNKAVASTKRPRPLWRNLNFTLMWTSTAASGFGDRIIMSSAWVLLGGLLATADSTSIQAGVSFFFFAPYILFSLPAGWLADRVPRKWIMLGCDETRGIAVLVGLAFLSGMFGATPDPDAVWWRVMAVVALAGTCAAVFNPARNAIVPEIIPRNQLQPANAVILGINVVASLCALQVFNLMTDGEQIKAMDFTSLQPALWMCACFYVVSGLFFAFLRPIEHQRVVENKANRSLGPAIRYTLRHRRLIVLIFFNILLWAAGALVFSSVPGLGRTHHDYAGEAMVGFVANVGSAVGLGMLGGALIIGLLGRRRESTWTLTGATTLLGLALIGIATVPSYLAAVMFGFLVGCLGNIAIVTTITTIQCLSPNYIRGRVMGITALSNTLISVLTYFSVWRVPNADVMIVIAVGCMGVLMLIVGATGFWLHLIRGPIPGNYVANGFWHFVRWYVLIYHRCRWVGRHHIPSRGKAILASNHTTGLDPLVMQAGSLRPIRWLMLTSYLFWPLNPLWRAIRPIAMEYGSNNTSKIRRLVEVLNDEEDLVGIFPEGSLQRTERELLPLQPGIVTIAKRTGAPIVPVHIHGTPLKHSMLLHFFWPGRVTVVFGRPWQPDPSLTKQAFLDELRRRMTELEAQIAVAHTLPCNG
ncbi:MFS transporter [Mucisphaera calidilacus]|uniref:1-acyl-sn-glycerol-3-phosphate acyltransferase n=1 Tax=Mucisphaera calidilacus TaxID=2527982 RepID=A0A518BXM3_9BACT|nr:MFS transporter [Mucisphaera calidilacus]QDU71725.1 1-acyl-sn-glycerol-3-phosphate acyltransferase [Mucisphaera calidilacus]